ncbi:hypothetical protein LCGC14_1543340 [marine sediment metagenome]|uniref:Uncharacterized protein n=1 Tax=marine sediment metagenome TaxID=412755 RepID=A0A0F9ISG5_9ZZZZ
MGATEIEKILEDLDNLHKRMEKWLEEQKNQKPIVPIPHTPIGPIPFTPVVPNPIVSKCPLCEIEIHQVMGYYCSRPNCPTGLGGPSCTGQIGHSAITIGKPIC